MSDIEDWEQLDEEIPDSVLEGAQKHEYTFSNKASLQAPTSQEEQHQDISSLKAQHFSQFKPEESKLAKLPKAPKPKPLPEVAVDKSSLISKVKSEFPDLEEPSPKQVVNLVFIGHVDAGKSTLCGHLLLQQHKIDERLVQQYKSEAEENMRGSWWLAYIMDINHEEREKGKTVEVGKACFETPSKRFVILDAPGHKRYVPNMIHGVTQADIGVVVVSSRQGEFEAGFEKGGQTREHVLLARSKGITCFVVLLTKMDDPSVNWSYERFCFIKNSLEPFFRETCKVSEVYWVPVSGLSGQNLSEPEPQVCSWYSEGAFLEVLDKLEVQREKGPLRVPIIDKGKDQGVYFLGKVESGLVVKDLKVTIMPVNLKATIQEICGPDDTKLVYAEAGENLKIKLKTQEDIEIQKGYVICDTHNLCEKSNQFLADVLFLDLPPQKPIVGPGYTCVLHLHTSLEECTVVEVLSKFDQQTKKQFKTSFAKPNTRVKLRIQTQVDLCFENFGPLSRFTLRDEDYTIALGKVIKAL